MQTVLALHNLLKYAQATDKAVTLYLRPLGLRSTLASPVDDGKYSLTGYRFDQEERQPADIPVDGWTDPFWRVMEAAGYRVAVRRRIARGEVLWTLTPMQQRKQAGIPRQNDLLKYVQKVRPLAGERAQRALEIATSGQIHKLVPAADGKDRWQVESSQGGHYTVSIAGRSCTCPDAANGAPRWKDAPLCKHRLAVMFIIRWQEDQHCQYECDAQGEADDTPGEETYMPPAPPYITVAPPSHSKQGWRWVTVRPEGELNRHSRDEYADAETAMGVARMIANSYGYPLHLDGVHSRGRDVVPAGSADLDRRRRPAVASTRELV